ncbi:MAG TPA: pitrilysin family protein [Polyangia bacterium]|nr:pitrilysin family protein [Polyangia bacterium]
MNAAFRYQLPNGLTVVLQENHASPVVAFQAWVGVGSADEPPELAGIAHVFEHMLFKGTARRGVGQIAQEVEGAGGEINAWTSFDQTVYHLVLASRFFDTGLDILSDALQNSSFDPGELERELKVVLEEVKQGEDNPSRVATQAMFGTAYQKHPYRRPVIGYTKTVKSFTRERLLDFFRRYYVANNVTLVVVGDFDRARAQKKIAEAFAEAKAQPITRPDDARKEPQQRAPRVVVTTQQVREAYLAIAFHVPGIHHEDTGSLDVASIILGQGDSSRLTLSVKRQAQLVNDAYAYSYTPRDPGLLVAGATMPTDKLEAAMDALAEQVFRLGVEDVTAEEVRKAKAIIESDAIYQKETVQGQARKLGFFETVAGGLDYEAEYNLQVQRTTPERIRETVRRYLTVENATIAVLLPNGEASRVAPLEKSLADRLRAAYARAEERWSPAKPALAREAADGGEVVRVKLPSGARLLVKRDRSVGLVAMRAVWMGGLRYEDEKSNGVNNLLAGLVTRGTRTRTGDEIAHEVEGMAGSIGGFSGRNSFGMRMELLSRQWERGLEIFADCILNPSFADDELEKERRQVLEEIRTQEDNVSAEAFRLFSQTLYKKHPYRFDMYGSAQSVAGLTRKRLSDYYKRFVAPEQMTLAIVGDVDPAQVVAKARALFGVKSKPADRAAVEIPVDAPPSEALQVFRFQNKQQAHVVYGFPGSTVSDPDRFALEVLATILSGQGGRLFVELRDKRGLAYRVSAFSVEGVDPGYFAVYIATSPQNLGVAVAGIQDELNKLIAEPVPKAELERAKRYLVGAHDISLQRRAALASTLAFHECYGLGWDEYRRYAPAILAVGAADVQRVAKKYLDPRRSILATIKPEETTPVLAKAKAKTTPTQKAARANGAKRGGTPQTK